MKTETYHFVPLDEFIQWIARGWELVSDLSHHSEYSVLMRKR